MPGRRRLTTLLYAFPERTERCSFPTPSTPVLPFYSSPSSFFLRPPPSPPRLSLLSSLSLFLSLLFSSFPFPYSTRCSALPGTRHLAARTFFHFFLSIVLVCAVSSRNGGIGKENASLPLPPLLTLYLHFLSCPIRFHRDETTETPPSSTRSLPSFRPSARFFGATA